MRDINRLAEVFKEKDVYNRDIAKHLNKSEETVSRWVNNHRQPSVNDLNEIAEFLRVDIRELLYPSDWSSSQIKGFKVKNNA
ncbi:XRE family transcriptional regulator [Pedobacter sp. KBW01]|uniref:helix-turn-helix transcriptional regulator n=1 Tax=Pedobacter sp. KBW01 TaxID=2153364 RepID=UPI000F5A13D4|nr:helix-turn-helix transcriptional regulator [Pedobacter sp. KBW01]RQO73760.1 XRE family transcriptional regulator [Pedobacter sp. KBW01]